MILKNREKVRSRTGSTTAAASRNTGGFDHDTVLQNFQTTENSRESSHVRKERKWKEKERKESEKERRDRLSEKSYGSKERVILASCTGRYRNLGLGLKRDDFLGSRLLTEAQLQVKEECHARRQAQVLQAMLAAERAHHRQAAERVAALESALAAERPCCSRGLKRGKDWCVEPSVAAPS